MADVFDWNRMEKTVGDRLAVLHDSLDRAMAAGDEWAILLYRQAIRYWGSYPLRMRIQ